MNTIFLASAYGSLGMLLEQLAVMPEVISSPEADKKLKNAIYFYNEIGKQYQELIDVLQDATSGATCLPQRERDPDEERPRLDIRKYIILKDDGMDARQICKKAEEDGFNYLNRLRLLRALVGLPLNEAIDIEVSTD